MFDRIIKRGMNKLGPTLKLVCKLSLSAAFFSPITVLAQEASQWEYHATIYGYFPDAGGTTVFPSGGGSGLSVSSKVVPSDLKFAFMGAIDMHNGKWGIFSDFIYLDYDTTRSGTRDFTLSNSGIPVGIPASTSADINTQLKATVWTIAGEYRVISTPAVKMDVLAGTRMLKIRTSAGWNISGSTGTWTGAQSGSASQDDTFWDGIVGVKGHVALGNGSGWSIPYYLDAGTGNSQSTWQAATGISYAFSWGEASAMWRYLEYDTKSGKALQDVNFSGPMVGATFKF